MVREGGPPGQQRRRRALAGVPAGYLRRRSGDRRGAGQRQHPLQPDGAGLATRAPASALALRSSLLPAREPGGADLGSAESPPRQFTASIMAGRVAQAMSFFAAATPEQMLQTAAPWK